MSVVRDASELLRLAKDLSSWIVGEKKESLRLDCMNQLGTYFCTMNVSNSFQRWIATHGTREKSFSLATVYDVKVIEVKPPSMREIFDAVRREGDRIVLDLRKCVNSETFRLEVYYRMDEKYLGSMVHSRSSPEPFGDETKFNLSAQLKDPSGLATGFREVDIEEYPLTARIHIKENLDTAKTGLSTFRQIRSIERDILSEYDPRKAFKLAGLLRERHELRRKLLQENPQEVLRELTILLRPMRFLGYLKLEEGTPFKMHKCQWGNEKLEMPGSVFLPENMEVTVRADLDLDNPGVRGTLRYQSGQFSRDVQKALEKIKGERD